MWSAHFRCTGGGSINSTMFNSLRKEVDSWRHPVGKSIDIRARAHAAMNQQRALSNKLIIEQREQRLPPTGSQAAWPAA